MKLKEVYHCSFQNWYENFKKVTFKSLILPLPDGFVSYILEDGIVLPESCKPLRAATPSDSDSDEEKWENCDEQEAEAPHFQEFDEKIKASIERLGGKVFPKLNWSSPQDASWISFNNSCCCTTVSDIYLLLKSSDFVVYDLTKMLPDCEDYLCRDKNDVACHNSEAFYLVLRKWVEIDTSGEFRCFVKDNNLIGISQREHSLYFNHIGAERKHIIADIVSFFHRHIQNKFPCSSYVFDIYRKKKDHIYLIDFNPFGRTTEALLFDWEELSNGLVTVDNLGLPQFRYVTDNRGVQPRVLSYHAIPRDIVDISTGEDSFKLVDLIKLKIDEQNEDTSSDDNTD